MKNYASQQDAADAILRGEHRKGERFLLHGNLYRMIDDNWMTLDEEFTPEQAAKFEEILDLEHEVQGNEASAAFAPANLPLHLKDGRAKNLKRSQDRLYAAINALSPADAKAFGDYRRKAR